MNSKSIPAAAFMASFSANGRIEEPPVDEYNARKRAEWEADRESACKAAMKVNPAVTTETREQANRRKVAAAIAQALRSARISAADARLGGLGAITPPQKITQRNLRLGAAIMAGCREGYVPSDATWELACSMLEVAQ